MGACSTGYLEAFFWSQQYKVVQVVVTVHPVRYPGTTGTCVYHSSTRSTKCTSKYMYKVYHRNIDTTTCSIKSLGTHSYILHLFQLHLAVLKKNPFQKELTLHFYFYNTTLATANWQTNHCVRAHSLFYFYLRKINCTISFVP